MMRHTAGIRFLFPPAARHLPLPGMGAVRHTVRKLNDTVMGIINVRRVRGDEQSGGDLLSTLMAARDENGTLMSTSEVHDELLTFLLAEHETTALALTLAREVANEFEVEGYRIPARANLVMSQWLLHHDARYFHNPDKFDPDRWGTEACQKLPRFAYFPFGGGPRQCIGAGFAMMEAVLLLATIASRFRLRLVEGQVVIPVPSFTLRPKYGIHVQLHRREHTVSLRTA